MDRSRRNLLRKMGGEKTIPAYVLGSSLLSILSGGMLTPFPLERTSSTSRRKIGTSTPATLPSSGAAPSTSSSSLPSTSTRTTSLPSKSVSQQPSSITGDKSSISFKINPKSKPKKFLPSNSLSKKLKSIHPTATSLPSTSSNNFPSLLNNSSTKPSLSIPSTSTIFKSMTIPTIISPLRKTPTKQNPMSYSLIPLTLSPVKRINRRISFDEVPIVRVKNLKKDVFYNFNKFEQLEKRRFLHLDSEGVRCKVNISDSFPPPPETNSKLKATREEGRVVLKWVSC